MARAIDANELEMFPYSEGAGTEEQIAEWVEQVGLSEDDTASRARDLCWKVIEGFINVVKTQPTLTPPNEPLTLEQLRDMDGEPVWVTPLGFWALVIAKPGERVKLICNDGEIVYADKEIELVGPVYRRPPEGEANG